MIISAPRLFVDGAFTGPGAVALADGVITHVYAEIPDHVDIALNHGFLSPGLIDLHNNGAFGVDFASASPAQWDNVIAQLTAHGVTSVLPTIITAPLNSLHESAGRVAAAMATHGGILGVHIEGPFLAAAKRGAHRANWLLPPDAAALLGCPALRLVTLAPELPGAVQAIAQFVAAGVAVSLGHTQANAAHMQAAAAAGATMVTHVFNAQSPLHHREPGAPGIALTDERLWPCLIADGLHVDPAILRLAFAACPRAVAVTDSILIAGLEVGAAGEFGGARAYLSAEGLGRRNDGTIAGAGIILDEGVRRLIAAGISPATALAGATTRPAAALGLTDRGALKAGQRADIIWWDETFNIQRVWQAGIPAGAATATAHQPRGTASGTESVRTVLMGLETRPVLEIVRTFLGQERAAQIALGFAAPKLAELAEATAAKLATGGRLFYAGAGTSGRLALLDAVECGPTFNVAEGLIIPLLAGGETAFLHAVEGAEDDGAAAITALTAQNFSAADTLIGIAASGTTPFTLAAIEHAKALGGLTGAIVNNVGTPIAAAARIAVEINTGAEIIAGSTRLSAGTTQKIALNILSSTIMIKLGKTHGPYMVDVRATNEKLRRRAVRITAAITGVSEATAAAALITCGYEVKAALQMLKQP
ncbi:MAG: N-acetylglucosamine-6-phosphate deacetylase [Acidocella sp.]|nr:N-acetylglucosamine-6-phosphate deacetylase [Acidocella sp.]